ncbi:hypothetical protein EK904_006006 [Melospiza melodia maxima]|nr:hypothetical protein EK904_006006 [Melospiza melodia maxima]
MNCFEPPDSPKGFVRLSENENIKAGVRLQEPPMDSRSSLTGDMMSNWMGVSGATRESKERAERAAESEPRDPELLVRAAGGRDCLQQNQKGKVRIEDLKEENGKQFWELQRTTEHGCDIGEQRCEARLGAQRAPCAPSRAPH